MQRGEKKRVIDSLWPKTTLSIRSLSKMLHRSATKAENCYVAHKEEETQNKYKLVLCADKYTRGERG